MTTPIQLRRIDGNGDRGAALLMALIGSLCLTSLGLGLVVLSDTEQAASANYRSGHEALYAADAIAERTIQDLLQIPDWSLALSGASRSPFFGPGSVTTPYGETFDVSSRTAEVQALSDARAAGVAWAPQWRLFAHGPLAGIDGDRPVQSLAYVAAWVADDSAEIDGDPRIDANGAVLVLGQALSAHGARRTVAVTIARGCVAEDESSPEVSLETCVAGATPVVRVLSWREVR